MGEGDCDNKGVNDGENRKESNGENSYGEEEGDGEDSYREEGDGDDSYSEEGDGEDSYSEEEGDGEISIPATVIITVIINAFILSCMYNIKPVDESMTQ